VHLAEKLMGIRATEEKVSHPTALLIGDYPKACLARRSRPLDDLKSESARRPRWRAILA
jgi:hypothetical protein